MSRSSDGAVPAHTIAPGSFVATLVDQQRVICLKAERISKDHVNHFLVQVDPVAPVLALIYIDPDTEITPIHGLSFAFADGPESDVNAPDVGQAFVCPAGTFIKVMDDPQALRLHAYVDVATGMVRLRMERQASRVLHWSVQLI